MKNVVFIVLISGIFMLASCASSKSAGFNKNTGFSARHNGTVSLLKGGKTFCKK